MKRYRVLIFDFDTRANILNKEIQEDWEDKVKALWKEKKANIHESLIATYGTSNGSQKVKNFTELGPLPFSIIAFHNKFLIQARDAYIIGAYYPALTSSCALGERILNQLIIHLRDDYKKTKEYKNVHNKDSFDNWDLAINTLESWSVLHPDVVAIFKELKEIRNQSIHFDPEVDLNDKELALSALKKLTKIVERQFSVFGSQPWVIPSTAGAAYICKDWENKPFVRRIVLPSCALVGPRHRLELVGQEWTVLESHAYEDKDISDNEFATLLEEARHR